jgi:protoheme IX farnesyltransferase
MSRFRFAAVLAAATVGTYALAVAGATTAATDAAAACSTWPTCGGAVLADASLAVAWLHRVAAVAVGAVVLAAAVLARTEPRRVRWVVWGAAALYPVQVGIGAVTAVSGGGGALSALHLVAALAIFGALVVALARSLDSDTPQRSTKERASSGDPPATTVGAYVALTKPRLMWLLSLVAAAAMALAAGPDLSARTVGYTLGGGVLAIGASGTFNHVLERDRDRKMARTADRPLVEGRIPVRNAVAFGAALAVASVAAFLQVNVLAAALGLVAIVFYSVVYTLLLKPNTVQNTVLGGFAGSLPALIGWAAVTGELGLPGVGLAALIFLWTPAHFYNLALAYRDDYERGGFPMLPVVRGDGVARTHVLLYLGATLVAAAALAAATSLDLLFAGTSVALGAVFLWAAVRLHRERTAGAALRAFHASNAYLGAVLVAAVLDAMLV